MGFYGNVLLFPLTLSVAGLFVSTIWRGAAIAPPIFSQKLSIFRGNYYGMWIDIIKLSFHEKRDVSWMTSPGAMTS